MDPRSCPVHPRSTPGPYGGSTHHTASHLPFYYFLLPGGPRNRKTTLVNALRPANRSLRNVDRAFQPGSRPTAGRHANRWGEGHLTTCLPDSIDQPRPTTQRPRFSRPQIPACRTDDHLRIMQNVSVRRPSGADISLRPTNNSSDTAPAYCRHPALLGERSQGWRAHMGDRHGTCCYQH